MKAFLYLCALLLALSGVLLVTSCSVERQAVATDAKVDSALVAAGIPPLALHKIVFRGPVTLQVGHGNTSTTTGKDKTVQRTQAMSTGANSPVTASEKKGNMPWWVFLIVAVVGAAGWEWLSHQVLNPLGWLSWRAKSS